MMSIGTDLKQSEGIIYLSVGYTKRARQVILVKDPVYPTFGSRESNRVFHILESP